MSNRKPIFLGIDINLSAKLCDCIDNRIIWTVPAPTGMPELLLTCDKCKTKLHISHEKFLAAIKYPNAKTIEEKKEEPRSTSRFKVTE